MNLASHNSWSYATPKKWWMKLLRFTAKCQDVDIKTQYEKYGVRMFDLRLKFNAYGPVVVHNIIEYDISKSKLLDDLNYLNDKGDCAVRILLDVRTEKNYTSYQRFNFIDYCTNFKNSFRNISFFGGDNLYNYKNEYHFTYQPYVIEKYSSVCSPKIIDDWYPRWYAKHNNEDNKKNNTNCDYLMIDFVNI